MPHILNREAPGWLTALVLLAFGATLLLLAILMQQGEMV